MKKFFNGSAYTKQVFDLSSLFFIFLSPLLLRSIEIKFRTS